VAARIQTEPFEPAVLLDEFTRGRLESGAVVSFTGLARAVTAGQAVTTLELDAYPRFTLPAIEQMAEEARAGFEIQDVLVVHRYGPIAPGEAIVFVATAAEHRRAAFEAADYLMDRLKTEAPFWKKEHGPDGARWIEARDDDHGDADRWKRTKA
jgi:molybdopterin synthase catalytic subunit